MADSALYFENANAINDTDFEDATAMASDDGHDEDMDDHTYQDVDDNYNDDFELGSFGIRGSKIDNDSDDYKDDIVGRKRKRTSADTLGSNRNSKQLDTRIKAEGGESFILEEVPSLLSHVQSSRVVGRFGRHDRLKGETLPAYHKRVSADLNPDDKLMLEMRERGFSDRQIAEKLKKDGRTRYDQKTISTRIMRIRLAQAERFDILLQEGLEEWQMDDDQRLVQAYALADIEISYEIERVRAWRFRKVSDYMRRLDKNSLFSANACRIRYGELASGTARIPCNADDDPDTRLKERKAYQLSREAARDKEETDKETRQAMEKQMIDAVKIKNAQKAEDIANKRAVKEQENARRLMQRAAQAQLRSQKAAENRKAKMERNAQIKKAASIPRNIDRKKAKTDASAESSKAPSVKATTSTPVKDEPETVDPRSYLSLSDLTTLCINRGLPTENKTKKALVTSLIDADREWSHSQLRQMCKAKKLSSGGNKTVMRYQLALKAAQGCASFEAGIKTAREAEDDGGDGVVVDAE
ncbi:hypothetical protein OPT61_g1427 [Boeremia exigua]|uniref:Uncharacterized protein n=1 Tax=Boeremia exigua TaxID=749465 RepID=A0ACC2IQB7_9PLEO|nr:hypothetical protein OPT61_g1427 [Boeremia exigua]